MRAGDKIVCSYDNLSSGITKGKIYIIISCIGGYYIKNDWGDYGTYHVDRFLPIEKHRQLKLNIILND